MIAAVPERPHTLELVRLILSLVSEQNDIPLKLKQHLIDVIQSAKRLAEDPQSAGNVSPEAIELAVEIQREAALATTLRGVTSFENIDPALARQLLGQMEARAA